MNLTQPNLTRTSYGIVLAGALFAAGCGTDEQPTGPQAGLPPTGARAGATGPIEAPHMRQQPTGPVTPEQAARQRKVLRKQIVKRRRAAKQFRRQLKLGRSFVYPTERKLPNGKTLSTTRISMRVVDGRLKPYGGSPLDDGVYESRVATGVPVEVLFINPGRPRTVTVTGSVTRKLKLRTGTTPLRLPKPKSGQRFVIRISSDRRRVELIAAKLPERGPTGAPGAGVPGGPVPPTRPGGPMMMPPPPPPQ